MKHFYRNLPGYFTFPRLYSKMVNEHENANFAEVGCWLGRSAAYMGVEILNSGKNIHLTCIDVWSPRFIESPEALNRPELRAGRIYEHFLNNTKSISSCITAVRLTSIEASFRFSDGHFAFVFIDASHDYCSVRDDLLAWHPKVGTRGTLAGHDYFTHPGVAQAVNEFVSMRGLNLVTCKKENVWQIQVAQSPSLLSPEPATVL